MPIKNFRKQYAVGQGFFHAGELTDDHKLQLRYVVDCGAMNTYALQRDNRIDAYIALVRKRRQTLDILFVSHAHADHLNGVARLLDNKNGLSVKTIVMPLLNIEDRLIAYGRAVLEDKRFARSAFYKEFVVDPAAAFLRFNPDRIIFVESGNPEYGAPFSRGSDEPSGGPNGSEILRRGNTDLPWKFIGRGDIRVYEKDPTQNGSVICVIPDTLGLISAGSGTSPAWLLAPYIDPSVNAGKVPFMKSLAAALGQSIPALKKWLLSKENIKELLTAHVSAIRTAYAAIHVDLNITSMCLYSGPVPTSNPPLFHHWGWFGGWRVSGGGTSGIAWLGTGDAALANKKRLNTFLKHYGSLLQQVVTMTLPHHGSEGNFDPQLLNYIQPSFYIAAADQYSKWRHPGTSVIQSIASTGNFLSVVTSKIESEVSEMVIVN